jgi:tRNA-Thr(GGU) m(6)t(6)A37 methyltransferase TsaA
MSDRFYLVPIGIVHKKNGRSWIAIDKKYAAGLLGLDGFSHIHVLFWFHENDNTESRNIMQVHPRRDQKNPLTGVFATRSPVRPNLIGSTRCRILSIQDLIIDIEKIDARNNTPVLDIKCYIPSGSADKDTSVPDWV